VAVQASVGAGERAVDRVERQLRSTPDTQRQHGHRHGGGEQHGQQEQLITFHAMAPWVALFDGGAVRSYLDDVNQVRRRAPAASSRTGEPGDHA
jgi:hypothetical protein